MCFSSLLEKVGISEIEAATNPTKGANQLKITFTVAIVAVIAAVFLGLCASSALASDPIPGVDVKLGRNPGGIMFSNATTDSAGKFVFDNLAAGKYVLTVNPPINNTKTLINTTRSNIRHNIAAVNGVQVV